MIVKVFTYTKAVGGKSPLNRLFLTVAIAVVPMVLSIILSTLIPNLFGFLFLLSFIWVVAISIYGGILIRQKLQSSMTSFALDSSGNLYKVLIMSNVSGTMVELLRSGIELSDIVTKMVENAKETPGAKIIKFEKIHSCFDDKDSLKIVCDYQDMKTGNMVYQKNISIDKSYESFDELKNIIYNYPKNNN